MRRFGIIVGASIHIVLLCACGGGKGEHASGDEKVVYYLYDHQGTAQLIVDEQGKILHDGSLYPYGLERKVASEGSTVKGEGVADYVYTGKEYDEETGLIYFGQRYYSPALGRWMTPDPLGVEELRALNLYAYTRNNPITFVDPDGLWDERIHYGSDEFGGTLAWAQDIGFSPQHAEIMARADNGTDGPMLKWGTTGPYPWQEPSRHFNVNAGSTDGSPGDSRMQHAEKQLSLAVELARQGAMDEAVRQLGIGLHSVQDASAHRSSYVNRTFGVYHHLLHMEADDPLHNVRGFNEVRGDTYLYLGRFREALTKPNNNEHKDR